MRRSSAVSHHSLLDWRAVELIKLLELGVLFVALQMYADSNQEVSFELWRHCVSLLHSGRWRGSYPSESGSASFLRLMELGDRQRHPGRSSSINQVSCWRFWSVTFGPSFGMDWSFLKSGCYQLSTQISKFWGKRTAFSDYWCLSLILSCDFITRSPATGFCSKFVVSTGCGSDFY